MLESWTAENPLYVISQAFIGGKSVGSGYLDQAAARTYNGYNVSTYHPGYSDEDFTATLTDMKNDGAIASAKFMTNADVPVPTLFAGYPQGDAASATGRTSMTPMLSPQWMGCIVKASPPAPGLPAMPTRTPRHGTPIPATASLRSGWRTALT